MSTRAAAQRIVATVVCSSALECAVEAGGNGSAPGDGAEEVENEFRMRYVGNGILTGAEARNLLPECARVGADKFDVKVLGTAHSTLEVSSVVDLEFREDGGVCKESQGTLGESFCTPESNGSEVTRCGGAMIGKEVAGVVKKGCGGLGVRRGSQRPAAYATMKVAQSQSD